MQPTDLLSHFSELTDPRIDRTKHYPLMEIIFLVISATIVVPLLVYNGTKSPLIGLLEFCQQHVRDRKFLQ